jgi:hypothetical protein
MHKYDNCYLFVVKKSGGSNEKVCWDECDRNWLTLLEQSVEHISGQKGDITWTKLDVHVE